MFGDGNVRFPGRQRDGMATLTGPMKALVGLALLTVCGCASQSELSQCPDLRVDPETTPAVLSPMERQQAIEELQNAAAGNTGN